MNRLISTFRHWFVQNRPVVEASQKASASAYDNSSAIHMLTQFQQEMDVLINKIYEINKPVVRKILLRKMM